MLGAALSSLVGACGPSEAPLDASTHDAALDLDAGHDAGSDGGTDAALDLDAGPRRCLGTSEVREGTDAIEDTRGRATLTFEATDACLRTYHLATTAVRRDYIPASPRTFAESADAPTLRTGHAMFDALFALALAEARENSVASIQDGAFDSGAALPCPTGGCFETGRLWTYVWTRDTSYSMHLGLADLDPTRARNSLEFKLSERRGGGGEQVVQDTGTGGSYPVSSDRVVWSLAARALLAQLDGDARTTFRDRAYVALRNTLDHDREVVFDATRGLYRGETSFLDWREQSYAAFTAGDVVTIAESESLSTNVVHLEALELVADLATERGETSEATRFRAEADALRARIVDVFWDADAGVFRAFTPSELDRAPVQRVDLLATSLAVLAGLVTGDDARRALAAHPHFERGAPVIAPQQQSTAIYHNRAEWPFVTAYELLAAREARHGAIATHAIETLVHGAALALTNLENHEVVTGLPYVDEGSTSGPVVNSQRQLWSVAGYLGMVAHGLFGIETSSDGVRVAPFVPADLVADYFDGASELTLNAWPIGDRRLTVVVHLPSEAAPAGGDYVVTALRLNGVAVTDPSEVLAWDALDDENRVDVELSASSAAATSLALVDSSDYRNVFGPRTPSITALTTVSGHLRVDFDLGGESGGVTASVYRDGALLASGLTDTSYLDGAWDAGSERSPCYVVETCFASSGTCSQHSAPACFWGVGNAHIRAYDASSFTVSGGSYSTDHGRAHYEPWGDAGHTLEVTHVATQSGEHLVQLDYGNGSGGVTTGITCVNKRVVVEDVATGDVVGTGIVVMPQLGSWDRWEDSTFVRATLVAGRTYRIRVLADDTSVNMSSFEHFARYTGGTGGDAPFARVNIATVRVLAL